MRERVKLKLSLLYCTVESVESVLGSVEPTFKPTSRRRAYSCTCYARGGDGDSGVTGMMVAVRVAEIKWRA